MLTRIQVNSKTAEVDVYKSMPSAQPNSRYSLTLENVTVPPMSHGYIFNKPLFSVLRRLDHGTDVSAAAPVPDQEVLGYTMTFTPNDVKTIGELVFQLNEFFKKGFVKNIKLPLNDTDPVTHPDLLNLAPYDGLINPDARDWYELYTDATYTLKDFLQAVVTPSGHIGFKFNPVGQRLFVLKFTEEGQRIFGHQEYLAIDDNQQFEMPYIVNDAVNLATLAEPDEPVICILSSVVQHLSYRHEIVITTSLPMRNVLQCDQATASIKPEFVSYRYPSGGDKVQFESTMFQTRVEKRQSQYQFERGNKTHNSFLLTGTDFIVRS